jgi:hypothetical protein
LSIPALAISISSCSTKTLFPAIAECRGTAFLDLFLWNGQLGTAGKFSAMPPATWLNHGCSRSHASLSEGRIRSGGRVPSSFCSAKAIFALCFAASAAGGNSRAKETLVPSRKIGQRSSSHRNKVATKVTASGSMTRFVCEVGATNAAVPPEAVSTGRGAS